MPEGKRARKPRTKKKAIATPPEFAPMPATRRSASRSSLFEVAALSLAVLLVGAFIVQQYVSRTSMPVADETRAELQATTTQEASDVLVVHQFFGYHVEIEPGSDGSRCHALAIVAHDVGASNSGVEESQIFMQEPGIDVPRIILPWSEIPTEDQTRIDASSEQRPVLIKLAFDEEPVPETDGQCESAFQFAGLLATKR